MFKDLFERDDIADRYQDAGADLGVYTLELRGVEDPFDADPLWDRKYGGKGKVRESLTDDDDFRLQAALDGVRNLTYARDDAGRFRELSPVFTDVVMWIPERAWHADSLHGGRRLEAVAGNLAALHARKFGRSLPRDRTPNYTVMPAAELAEDAVAFQFGVGVFVPNDADVLIGRVLMGPADGELEEIAGWSFWHKGAQVKRPAGVYRGQGSLLITPDAGGPVRAPAWFAHRRGHIAINLNAADAERVYADDDAIKVSPGKPVGGDGTVEWELTSGDDASEKLRIAIRPVDEPQALPRSREAEGKGEEPRPGALARLFGQDEEDSRSASKTPISSRFDLRLAGIALMRIDGAHEVPGLRQWTIWFDADGLPLDHRTGAGGTPERGLALRARADSAELYYRLPRDTGFKPVVAIPSALKTESGSLLTLDPSPLPELHHGILRLDADLSFPLSSAPLVLGRSSVRPKNPQPDLPLELFTHPHSLKWESGSPYKGAQLNSLNLSRRHLSARLTDDGRLELAVAEGNAAVHVLSDQGEPLTRLDPGVGLNGPVLLEPGQLFVVGGYVLRFNERSHRTMQVSEASVALSRRRNLATAE